MVRTVTWPFLVAGVAGQAKILAHPAYLVKAAKKRRGYWVIFSVCHRMDQVYYIAISWLVSNMKNARNLVSYKFRMTM